MKVIVPLSGGADSVAVLLLALQEGHDVYPVFINYGQKSAELELNAAKKAVKWAKTRDLVDVSLPLNEASWLNKPDYIPGRNAFISLVAANYAISVGAREIWMGFHKGYNPKRLPLRDQSSGFLASMTELLKNSLQGRRDLLPRFEAPFLMRSKTYILKKLVESGYPIDEIWTCYTPKRGKPCGKCGSCSALAQAREESLANFK